MTADSDRRVNPDLAALVPDDFDLDERRREQVDKNDQRTCGICGSVKVHSKTGKPDQRERPEPYRCGGCGCHLWAEEVET